MFRAESNHPPSLRGKGKKMPTRQFMVYLAKDMDKIERPEYVAERLPNDSRYRVGDFEGAYSREELRFIREVHDQQ
jgi:hypothetical protein